LDLKFINNILIYKNNFTILNFKLKKKIIGLKNINNKKMSNRHFKNQIISCYNCGNIPLIELIINQNNQEFLINYKCPHKEINKDKCPINDFKTISIQNFNDYFIKEKKCDICNEDIVYECECDMPKYFCKEDMIYHLIECKDNILKCFHLENDLIYFCEECNMKICKECKNDIHKEHKIFNYNDLKIQYEINVKNCKNFNRFIGLFNKEKEGENGMYKMLVSIINIILFFYENFNQKKKLEN